MKFRGKRWVLLGSAVVNVLLVVSVLRGLFAQDEAGVERAANKQFLPLIAGAASPSELTVVQQPLAAGRARTDQIIVRYAAGVQSAGDHQAAQMQALSAAAGVALTFVRPLDDHALVVKLPEGREETAIARMGEQMRAALPEVASVEPDRWMTIAQTPNDPYYGYQWHYVAPGAGQYGANLPGAWAITTGDAATVIAVIDTGILDHADLTGRTVPGYDFIGDALVGNDGDGRDSNPRDPGDWITSSENGSGYFAGCGVRNSSWHGTHVAGTIAANSNNGIGVAGINWQAKILPLRVLGKCGGYTSDIADAIRWAAGLAVSGVPTNANPARVINLSLGGWGGCGTTYQNAINAAVNAGTVVVVAAGNSSADAADYTPASCANVITVAATSLTGSRAYYSNYGVTVELSAPGGDFSGAGGGYDGVLSTLNNGTTAPASDSYAFYQGTSMAAPHVAGIASLLFAVNPHLAPAQVTTLLQSAVTAFPAGSTCTTALCGVGIINAAAAVAAAQQSALPTATSTPVPPTDTPTPTEIPAALPTATALTATSTATETPTETPVPTATLTPTLIATSTPTPTETLTATATPTATPAPPTATPTATVTPLPTGYAVLALSPAMQTVGVGQTFSVTINVRTTQAVDGASAYLNFDPTKVRVAAILAGNTLPVVVQQQSNHSLGQLNFAAGALSAPYPTSTFVLATVIFTATSRTAAAPITFAATDPRTSNITFSGRSVLDHYETAAVTIDEATVVGRVQPPGRPAAPHAQWRIPVTITMQSAAGGPTSNTVTTLDASGYFTLTGYTPGVWRIGVKGSNTLRTVLTVDLGGGVNPVNFALLRGGDANGDNYVTLLDFSILATTFAQCSGGAPYDPRADFNGDGCVTLLDFSLLSTNFSRSGDTLEE